MEHTFLASYVCLLIGNLIMECKQYEMEVRNNLHNHSFVDMVQVLEKYYNFMNLTASVSIRNILNFQKVFFFFEIIV